MRLPAAIAARIRSHGLAACRRAGTGRAPASRRRGTPRALLGVAVAAADEHRAVVSLDAERGASAAPRRGVTGLDRPGAVSHGQSTVRTRSDGTPRPAHSARMHAGRRERLCGHEPAGRTSSPTATSRIARSAAPTSQRTITRRQDRRSAGDDRDGEEIAICASEHFVTHGPTSQTASRRHDERDRTGSETARSRPRGLSLAA